MAILVFLLSLVLLAAGAVCGYLGLDLLPTGPGLLYVFAGSVAVVGALVVFALGVVAMRLRRLTEAVRDAAAASAGLAGAPEHEALEAGEPERPEPEAEAEAAPQEAVAAEEDVAEEEAREAAADVEEPVNENRAGHLPTLGEIERAIETPEPPPTLIGRYSSGGANYMIFSDGTIEAETDEGAFKFASMGDFKQFLMDRNAGKA
jgi:hypothetical protein